MIIKGSSRSSARNLARHLLRADTNETVRQIDTRGTVSSDLSGALDEMAAVAAGSRTSRFLYHASINVERGAALSDEQWQTVADRLGAGLGLDGHQRVIVLHRKAERDHLHVVWNRVDVETLKSAHMTWNYEKHEIVARELEKELGLQAVKGVHHQREGARPERRPSPAEMQQAERTKISIPAAEATVRPLWEQADSGRAFVSALEEQGWQLARGDRNDYTIVDPAGGTHPGAKRIGQRIAALRDKFSDLDLDALPDVATAQAMAAEARVRMQAEREAAAAGIAATAEIARQAAEAERLAAREAERVAAERAEAQRVEEEHRAAEAQRAAQQQREEQPGVSRQPEAQRDEDDAARLRRQAYRIDPTLSERHAGQMKEVDRDDQARRQAAAQEAKTWAGPEKRAAQAMQERHERQRDELARSHRAEVEAERPGLVGRLWQGLQRAVLPGRAAAQDRARNDAAARRQAQREALEDRQDREQSERLAANAAKRRDMAHRLDSDRDLHRRHVRAEQRDEIRRVVETGRPLRGLNRGRDRDRGIER